MKRSSSSSYIVFFATLVLSFSCATSSKTSQHSKNTSVDALANENKNGYEAYLSLGDYLQRYPGVHFTGSEIIIRGMVSTGVSQALFVVDNVVIGNSYTRAASLVDVNNIKHISVLKSGAESAAYGVQGSNGVIVIKTKKIN